MLSDERRAVRAEEAAGGRGQVVAGVKLVQLQRPVDPLTGEPASQEDREHEEYAKQQLAQLRCVRDDTEHRQEHRRDEPKREKRRDDGICQVLPQYRAI